jgi:hypothetical protein
MPNLESNQTQTVTLITLIIPLLAFFSCVFLVKDSPRNLILINCQQEAYHILEGMLGRNLTDNEKKDIHDDVYLGINHELKGNVKDLFSPKLLKTTISMMTIWCIHGFIFYGTFLTSGMTIKEIQKIDDLNKPEQSNYDIIIGQFIIAGILSPPIFIIGSLTELKFFGRKKSYFLANFIGMLGMLTSAIFPSQFSWLYGIGSSFMGAGNNLGNSYASEIYPTKIRETAISFMYFFSRVSTGLSQLVFLWIYEFGYLVPYYISAGILVISLTAIALLPYETHSKHLDVDHTKVHNEKLIVK